MLRTGYLTATHRPAAAAGPDPDTERVMVTRFEKREQALDVDAEVVSAVVDRHSSFSAATYLSSSPAQAHHLGRTRHSPPRREPGELAEHYDRIAPPFGIMALRVIKSRPAVRRSR